MGKLATVSHDFDLEFLRLNPEMTRVPAFLPRSNLASNPWTKTSAEAESLRLQLRIADLLIGSLYKKNQ